MVCSIFGHSFLLVDIEERLYNEVEKLIQTGYLTFYLGCHGEFDEVSLKVCCSLKEIYSNISIYVVTTALRYQIKYGMQRTLYDVISFDIDNEYFKNRIWKSNQIMVQEADLILCYVDMNKSKSGAKRAVAFAKKCNKAIINLYN